VPTLPQPHEVVGWLRAPIPSISSAADVAAAWLSVLSLIAIGLFVARLALVLCGVEGWVLVRSIVAYLIGFIMGASLSGLAVALAIFLLGHVPPDALWPWVVVGLIALIGGIFTGRAAVRWHWRRWFWSIFMFGGTIGAVAYLVVAILAMPMYIDDVAQRPLASLLVLLGLLVAAFALCGIIYVYLYRAVFPLLWWLRNGVELSAWATLAASRLVYEALLALLAREAGPSEFVAAAGLRLLVLAAAAILPFALMAYIMWVQNLTASFRSFFNATPDLDSKDCGLPWLLICALERFLKSLRAVVTFRRSEADVCLVLHSDRPASGPDPAPRSPGAPNPPSQAGPKRSRRTRSARP
jgi:hypothetical protein